MPAPQRIRVDVGENVRIVRFLDRELFDDRTVREASDQLMNTLQGVKPGEALVLDFSGVHNVSSSMIARLVLLQRRLDSLKAQLRLCELNQFITTVLQTTNLDRVFQVDRDLRESLARLAEGQPQ